mgnify:CR=1 FL=1
MRKLVLLLAAALALTACGSSAATTAPAAESAAGSTAEAASGDLLSEIQAKGTITVAMEGTWAPWTYHDENDNLVGYDVEVATEIAKKLGVEPQFVEGEWDGLLAGLDAGRYDIMVNGVDITPERAEKYDFSTPYAFNRTAVITKADDDSINTLEDLKGKKTANTISSTYAELADLLPAYCKENGFTHIELMPLAEHPFDGSWGYQTTGFFAPTSRYGTPDELVEFVNACHKQGIGVILDFVPVHFAVDAYGLKEFDGTPLYEYPAAAVGQSEWGSCCLLYTSDAADD